MEPRRELANWETFVFCARWAGEGWALSTRLSRSRCGGGWR